MPDTRSMSTAIVYAYVGDGFVIGADGRRTDSESGLVVRDDVQKIFSIRRNELRLVYAWSGAVSFAHFKFGFKDITDSILLDMDFSAPTAEMKAAGMVPLTLSATDMKALVSYVGSLGGASVSSAAKTPAAGSASPAPGKAKPAAADAPPELNGEAIFKAQCASCHGTNGVGGTAPRLAGQNGSYLVDQLLRFRAGERAHAGEMTPIAKKLNKKQIRIVSAFLASQ